MNRTLKIILCIVIVIWLFALGLVTGTFLMRNRYQKEIVSEQESRSPGISIDIVTDATSSYTSPTEEFSFSLPESDSRLSTYEAESSDNF